MLTLTLFPLALVALLGALIGSLSGPPHTVLPIVFALLALIVSDVATRDGRAGTTASVRSIPRLRENCVWWKLGSTMLLSLLFCTAAIVRVLPRGSLAIVALLVGIFFVAAAATSLGIMTANPKTFIVAFLTFWYVVVNDHGTNPLWDFAGFYGRATTNTVAGYAVLGLIALGVTQLLYRARLTTS